MFDVPLQEDRDEINNLFRKALSDLYSCKFDSQRGKADQSQPGPTASRDSILQKIEGYLKNSEMEDIEVKLTDIETATRNKDKELLMLLAKYSYHFDLELGKYFQAIDDLLYARNVFTKDQKEYAEFVYTILEKCEEHTDSDISEYADPVLLAEMLEKFDTDKQAAIEVVSYVLRKVNLYQITADFDYDAEEISDSGGYTEKSEWKNIDTLVRSLFKNKKLSPLDKNARGESLLKLAANADKKPFLKWLEELKQQEAIKSIIDKPGQTNGFKHNALLKAGLFNNEKARRESAKLACTESKKTYQEKMSKKLLS